MAEPPSTVEPTRPQDFIREIVASDLKEGRHDRRVSTRFPPEPNGYLHIGHAKSICLNFGVAEEFAGQCNLRFDDTNPAKEEVEYVDSIKEDVRWLGFAWSAELYASDYFERLYQFAVEGFAIDINQRTETFLQEWQEVAAERIAEHDAPGKRGVLVGKNPDPSAVWNIIVKRQLTQGIAYTG